MAIIAKNLDATYMLNLMESKEDMSKKGSLYVGTGGAEIVPAVGERAQTSVPKTTSLAPDQEGADNEKVLIVNVDKTDGTNVGWKIGQIRSEGIANHAVTNEKLGLVAPLPLSSTSDDGKVFSISRPGSGPLPYGKTNIKRGGNSGDVDILLPSSSGTLARLEDIKVVSPVKTFAVTDETTTALAIGNLPQLGTVYVVNYSLYFEAAKNDSGEKITKNINKTCVFTIPNLVVAAEKPAFLVDSSFLTISNDWKVAYEIDFNLSSSNNFSVAYTNILAADVSNTKVVFKKSSNALTLNKLG